MDTEQELLAPVSQALAPLLKPDRQVVADAGYHSDANLHQLEDQGIEATIPDKDYRRRDPRYAEQDAHRAKPDPLWDKRPQEAKPKRFGAEDFQVAQDASHCLCPAGKRLYRNGGNCNLGGRKAIKFTGAKRDCENGPLRVQWLRHPQRTMVRQVAILLRRHEKAKERACERMRRKIDIEQGRQMITRRFATVEPVFGNLRNNKRLDRFTLRGREKVDGQWKLVCLVHNIEKLANNGYAK